MAESPGLLCILEDALTRHVMREVSNMMPAYSRLGNSFWGAADDGIGPDMGKKHMPLPLSVLLSRRLFEYY